MKKISEEQAVNAQAKAFIKTLPNCHCESYQKIIDAMHLREAKQEQELLKLREFFKEQNLKLSALNIQLDSDMIAEIIKQNREQLAPAEVCECSWFSTGDMTKCCKCGKPIKEV